jgi:hypothetical protein
MIHIMWFQNGKSLPLIMFKIGDARSRKRYQAREDNIKYVYWFFIVISVCFKGFILVILAMNTEEHSIRGIVRVENIIYAS